MRLRNLSWPAVSQSCSLTVRSSKYIVFDRKSIPIVAWYVLSKLSYINLVIRDVFPTLCSPRKTSLNFLSGFPKSPPADMMLGEGPGDRTREKSSQIPSLCSWSPLDLVLCVCSGWRMLSASWRRGRRAGLTGWCLQWDRNRLISSLGEAEQALQ